jgi:hypothetical protein
MRNSTRKSIGKPRLESIDGWEGLKTRMWVRGLESVGPHYGPVLGHFEQGTEPLGYVKYGKIID